MSQPQTLRSRTARGLAFAAGEAFARAVLQFGVLIVLARLLTPTDYGVLGVALLVIGVSQIFPLLGAGPAIVQRSEILPRQLHTAFWVAVTLGLVTGVATFASAPALAELFRMPGLTLPLRVMSVALPVAGASVVSESLLQRELRFDTLARIEVLSYFVGFACVGIALAARGAGIWALVTAQLVFVFGRSAQMLAAARWRPQARIDGQSVRELWAFGTGQSIAQVANYVAQYGDNFVVGRTLGAEAMGLYTRAYQLMLAPAILVGSVLEKVLFPALSRLQDDRAGLGEAYRQGLRFLAVLLLPCAAGIALLAPDAVPLVLGERWRGVILPLQLFSAGLLWRTGMKVSNSVIRARGAVRAFATCQIGYAAGVVLFASVGSRAGIPGVCAGVLASIFLCHLYAAAVCVRLTGIAPSTLLRAHLPGVCLGAAVATAGWTAHALLPGGREAAALRTAIVALALLLTFVAGLALWPRFFLEEHGARLQTHLLRLWTRRFGLGVPAPVLPRP